MQTRSRVRSLICVLALAGACSKDSAPRTWDDQGRDADVVAANRRAAQSLKAPKMFAHIPADSPYVFASFEPWPKEYLDKLTTSFSPQLRQSLLDSADELAAALADDYDEQVALAAVLEEIGRQWEQGGLETAFGIGAEARFAFYGLGPLPVVRIEAKDPAQFVASVKNIAQQVGVSIRERTHQNHQYWQADLAGASVAFGFDDGDLYVTLGTEPAIERALPVLVGAEKLASTMADGGALKQLAAEYGYSGYGIGYVDMQRLVDVFAGRTSGVQAELAKLLLGTTASPACAERLDVIAAAFPRMVFGYDEVTSKRMVTSGVVETSPAVRELLRGMKARVPALSSRLPGRPLFAMGMGVDVDAVMKAMEGAGETLEAIADECVGGLAALGDDAADDAEVQAQKAAQQAEAEAVRNSIARVVDEQDLDDDDVLAQLDDLEVRLEEIEAALADTEGWDDNDDGDFGDDDDDFGFGGAGDTGLKGFVIVLDSLKLSSMGMPSNASGFMVVAMDDMAELVDMLGMLAPELAGLSPNGKFERMSLGFMTAHVAVRPDSLLVALDERGKKTLQRELSAGAKDAPLFIMSYDVAKVAKLLEGMGGMDAEVAAMMPWINWAADNIEADVTVMDVNERGLTYYNRVELK